MKTKGVVYFARCGKLVKIGYTEDLAARLSTLQTGNPKAITVDAILTDCTPAVEKMYHRAFHLARVRGEWFSYSGVHKILRQIQAGAQPKTPTAIAHYAKLGGLKTPKPNTAPTFVGPRKPKLQLTDDEQKALGKLMVEIRAVMRQDPASWAEWKPLFLERGPLAEQAVALSEKRHLTKQ